MMVAIQKNETFDDVEMGLFWKKIHQNPLLQKMRMPCQVSSQLKTGWPFC
jgi:hypothetical protein